MPGPCAGMEQLAAVCVCACVGPNPGNICQATRPGSSGCGAQGTRVRAAGVCRGSPGRAAPLRGQVRACTRVSNVVSKGPGGNKWQRGPQRAPQLWDLGTQQVKVGVLAGVYQTWCGHIQSNPKGEML